MTEDLAQYLEVIENLDRKDLTPGERKTWAAKKAELAEKIRPREGPKTQQGPKGPMWDPPTIKATAETAGVPFKTLQKWYTAYKAEHHGKDWNKQTEAEYQAFSKWLADAGEREKKAEADKAAAAAAKSRDDDIAVGIKIVAGVWKKHGDAAVLEVIEGAGAGHLLGGDDGR